MRERRLTVFFLFAAFLACAHSSEESDAVLGEDGGEESSEGVRLLTDDTFVDAVKDADFIVVEFYAPWCHHCAEVLEMLSDISSTLVPQGIQFAKVDIDQNKELKTRYQITSVPDIRMFRRGMSYPYMGPSDSEGKQALSDYFIQEATKTIEEGVLTLTEDNFDNIVTASPLVLVEFFADWCVHCQQLEPHFQAAARRLRQNDPPILLGQVKVPDQIELAKRYGITGYPLLIIFRNGQQYNYTGPREEEGIVRYMQRQAGPSSRLLTSVEDGKQFSKSQTEVRVIGFFSSTTDPQVIKTYMESGNEVRMDMELGHATDEKIAQGMGFDVDTVGVFHSRNLISKYEDGYSTITSIPSKPDSLAKLLLKHARPLVGQMTTDNQLTVYSDRPLLVAYFDLAWDLEIKSILRWHNIIASVAKDFTSKKPPLTFAIANEQDFHADLRLLGLSDWGEEVAVGIFAPGNTRYTLKDELTSENLHDFVQSFFNDELVTHFNSEPVPKNKKGNVIRKVVGMTFEKFLFDKSKNVVLKLCMPEHPDCEEAKAFFPKVAARYEGMEEIVFGEMNLALNDVPQSVTIEGEFPVYLFTAEGSKDVIQVSPRPTDDADLIFFLKFRHSVRPTLTERDIERRAKDKKRKKREQKKEGKKEKKSEKKKSKGKKEGKDEL